MCTVASPFNGCVGFQISTPRPANITSVAAHFIRLISEPAASFIYTKSHNAELLDCLPLHLYW